MNFYDGNNFIKHHIKNNISCAVGKIGGNELELIYYTLNGRYPEHFIREITYVAGVCPYSIENFQKFFNLYTKDLLEINALALWSKTIPELEADICQKIKAYPIQLGDIEPYLNNDPWSHELTNKKVLVISPFADSITQQYKQKDKIWPNGMLPSFNLQTLKYPHSSMIDPSNTHSIFENIDMVKDKMDKTDYDIAIVGAGAASISLTAHAKRNKKIGIHMGGPTQILFGVKGGRWDKHNIIKTFYNEHWIRPSKEETPNGTETIEEGCYW